MHAPVYVHVHVAGDDHDDPDHGQKPAPHNNVHGSILAPNACKEGTACSVGSSGTNMQMRMPLMYGSLTVDQNVPSDGAIVYSILARKKVTEGEGWG